MPSTTALPNIDILSIDLTNTIATKTISLKEIFLDLNLYESIQSTFLTGEITLLDTFDLQVNFPLIGNETLTIELTDQSNSVSKSLTFKVYKLNKDNTVYRGITNKKIVKLYFTSVETITNEQTKISKKFQGTAESIISSVITSNLNSSKTFATEASDGTSLDVYSNFWRPKKLIDFVSRKSKSASYSDYLFYENFDGFHFKTLSYLMAQDARQELFYSLIAQSLTTTHNVKMLKWDSNFDILANTHLGTMGVTYFKPHETNYSYTKYTNNFKDQFSAITGLGRNQIFDESVSNQNSTIEVNHYNSEISSVRNTSLKGIESYKISIKVNGDLDRRAGDVLQVIFPVFDSESNINNNFHGKFIILGINHIITNNSQYEQNILLGKNAFHNNKQMSNGTTLKNI